MIDISLDPSKKQLRQFSFACFLFSIFITLFTGFYDNKILSIIIIIIGLIIFICGFMLPFKIKSLYIALIFITYPIGAVISYFMLGAIFFVVIGITKLFFYIFNVDPLQLKINKNVNSFWCSYKNKDISIKNYFNQF